MGMSYKVALEKAWEELKKGGGKSKFTVRFFADEYEIDPDARRVVSLSCGVPPREHVAVLLLHYSLRRAGSMPEAGEDWISFKELPGGREYFDAFKKRAIDAVVRKYGDDPEKIFSCLERLPGRKFRYGDAGIVLEAFANVPVLITVWGRDEEFSADANVLFDRSIAEIFCTEDVAVLAGIAAREI
jgi:hypothetical protein